MSELHLLIASLCIRGMPLFISLLKPIYALGDDAVELMWPGEEGCFCELPWHLS